MAIADFGEIHRGIENLSPLVSRVPTDLQGDCRSFLEAVHDWQFVCERYDAEAGEYVTLLHDLFRPAGQGIPRHEHQDNAAQKRILHLHNALAVDIRSFYIFATIARKAAVDLIKRIGRRHAKDVLKQFADRLGAEEVWFDSHVRFYRDHFVVHPKTAALVRGFTSGGGGGVRLTGLTGRGLTAEDLAYIQELQTNLKSNFPEFAALAGWDSFEWIRNNLEKIPSGYQERVRKLIVNVGTESGELSQIAPRIAAMLAMSISLIREWLESRPNSAPQTG